ncbi:MAG: cell division ATP-binding protein FtsE [Ruminococcaceae bacterium]|nr:cell division ATP-binding protein FtsE [Oscillospiraceae bacterium]
MIFFDNVTKKYSNGVEAIKDLSFEIEKGEFVYLMGSSGAGKSTLIKLIMKEEKPTSGRIIVNARFLHKIRRSGIQKYKRNIGVVFQDFKLLKNKTVFENVAFAVEILGMRRSEINERVMAALELMGLAAKKNEYPQRLSGGEQQRVALARAIVNGPEILIADEPTGNLDPANSKEIMDMLMMINSRGTTVLIATHEKSLVQEYHKRIIQLDHGHDISDVPFEETPFTSHEESKEV